MINLRPNRPRPVITAKRKPIQQLKNSNQFKKSQPSQPKAKKPIIQSTNPKRKIKNPNTPYNDLRNNQRKEVIEQLRKGSVLIPHLFSTKKPNPRLPIERIGVNRSSALLDHNIIAQYTKNPRIMKFFENIVVNKTWTGMQDYEKQRVFNGINNIIQKIGEKRFTNLINTKEKQQRMILITLNKVRLRNGIDVLTDIANSSERAIKNNELNSRASVASIKSVMRHKQKIEKHQTIERRKLLNEISRIQEDGKKVINPKQQREIINLLMSEKSAFISNAVLKKFITTRAGVFVLVNWIKMEKGDRVFEILTKDPKLRYDFNKYIISPVGIKKLNHALSTPPRRNFFSRAILLAEEFNEHKAVFRIVEQFIKDPTIKKMPKLEKEIPKDLAKFLKQAMNKVRNQGF